MRVIKLIKAPNLRSIKGKIILAPIATSTSNRTVTATVTAPGQLDGKPIGL